MKVRYRFRVYPDESQQASLAKQFGVVRYAYNWALRQRIDAFRVGTRLGYVQSSALWTKHRNELEWAKEVSSVPPQQALRHLQTAFTNFFEKRNGFPSFKKKGHTQSAEYTTSGFAFSKAHGTPTLSLAKIGALKVRWSRPFASEPTTVTITKSPSGRYHVCLVLDEPEPKKLSKTKESIGVDFGVSRLATLSSGEKIANPKYLARNLTKLRKEQRKLARKTKGSHRRELQRIKVARLHEHIANSRQDILNKVTTDLVRRFDFIAIEDLHLRGMVKNHCLARSLSDAGIGMAARMLEYKAERYGKTVVKIDRWFPSSKTCSSCGHVEEALPLSIREWECPACHETHDRDVNAAINILAVGQTVSAHGDSVRPKKAKALRGKNRRSANLQNMGRKAPVAGIPVL